MKSRALPVLLAATALLLLTTAAMASTGHHSHSRSLAPRRGHEPALRINHGSLVTPVVGDKLTAHPGSWNVRKPHFSYQWFYCSANGNLVCTRLPVSRSAFTIPGDLYGYDIVSRVQARSRTQRRTVTVGSTGSVEHRGGPVLYHYPFISGAAREGQVLTVSTGNWSQATTSFTYQWFSCTTTHQASCVALGAEQSNALTVSSGMTNDYLAVKVTGSNTAGSATVWASGETPVAPTDAGRAQLAVSAPKPTSTADPTWVDYTPSLGAPVLPFALPTRFTQKVSVVGKPTTIFTGAGDTFSDYWYACPTSVVGSGCTSLAHDSAELNESSGARALAAGQYIVYLVAATNRAGTQDQTVALEGPPSPGIPSLSTSSDKTTRNMTVATGKWLDANGSKPSFVYNWVGCAASDLYYGSANTVDTDACEDIGAGHSYPSGKYKDLDTGVSSNTTTVTYVSGKSPGDDGASIANWFASENWTAASYGNGYEGYYGNSGPEGVCAPVPFEYALGTEVVGTSPSGLVNVADVPTGGRTTKGSMMYSANQQFDYTTDFTHSC